MPQPRPPLSFLLLLLLLGPSLAPPGLDLGGDLGDLGRGLGPCCRPTRYEDAAFLDSALRWQRLPGLSAGACACLG